MSASGRKRTLRATCRPILFDHLVGETVVELPLFNERGKLNRAIVQDFDTGGGASNTHGAHGVSTFMLPVCATSPAMKVNVPLVKLIKLELEWPRGS